ncbi:MAG: hypothetical protein WCK70_07935 [Chloroflexales bacterium]|jgi:CRISPR-associated protein (Cas_Cas02710)
MNRRRVSDIFGMITDPGVPFLFLLGTVVLAVLGNGVYDLVMELTTPTRDDAMVVRLISVSTGALVALLAVVAAMWLWYRLRRRRVAPDVTPAQLLDTGYAGLVLFVSTREDAAEYAAISHHLKQHTLRQLWMIVSQEARDKASNLTRWLRTQPGNDHVQVTQLPLSDAYDLSSAYDAVVEALTLAGQDLDQVIVDITSGTKHMSAGAVLVCRECGVSMQYVRRPYEYGVLVPDAPARLMKVRL